MTGEERATAKAYPTPTQYDRWKSRASELDMSISEFIQSMVEAGIKAERGFEIVNQQDETVAELREQRRELKRERNECQDRLEKARERLADRERETVHEFVVANSQTGVDFDAIVDRVQATAPQRVTSHLDALEGEQVQRNPNDGTWFAVEGGDG